MPRYYVEMTINFSGEIEADTYDAAEKKAWTAWGDTMDCEITYDGVDSISVDELDEDEEDN
jgi:hypothetical protein